MENSLAIWLNDEDNDESRSAKQMFLAATQLRTTRTVRTLHELYDKIRIFDDGFDDFEIELFKFSTCLRKQLDITLPFHYSEARTSLFGRKSLMFVIAGSDGFETISCSLKAYESAMGALSERVRPVIDDSAFKWARLDRTFILRVMEDVGLVDRVTPNARGRQTIHVHARIEPEMIRPECPSCGQRYKLSDSVLGKKLRCTCGHTFRATVETFAVEPAGEGTPFKVAELRPFATNPDTETAAFDKPTTTEPDAAADFVITMLRAMRDQWPSICSRLQPLDARFVTFTHEGRLAYEFTLAAIAVQMRAITNLLPANQTTRLREYIFECLAVEEVGDYPRHAIAEYEAAWDEFVAKAEPPFIGVASVLYDKLGLSSSVTVGRSAIKCPLLLAGLGGAVVQCGGAWWKTYIENHRIVA